MSQVHQPSKKYTNVARLVHLRQVHPLKLAASVQICEICGRSSPAEASVNSVKSVGGLLFAWLVQQRLLHPLKLHLCNLWETIPNRRFCEFCAICGRASQQAEAIRGGLFAATVSRLVTNIACYSVRRTARGQTGAGMKQTGAGGEYRALLH